MPKTVRLAVCVSILAMASVAFAESRSVDDGVYSKAQARVGEQLYVEHCLICHDKKYFRPVLSNWRGRSLELFFMMMSASMPQTNPGALRDQEYVDILAYILSLSRFPAGDEALDYRAGALNEISFPE